MLANGWKVGQHVYYSLNYEKVSILIMLASGWKVDSLLRIGIAEHVF